MSSLSPVEVVVIGGGASGVLTAARLLDASYARPVRVRVVEGSGRPAEGVAYGTEDHEHLLNVRAAGMSADPSDPSEFAEWTATHGLGDGNTFVARRRYRDYLQDHVAKAAEQAHDGTLEIVHDTAVAIDLAGTRPEVVLASGDRLPTDRIVLALGNSTPGTPAPLRPLQGHPAWIADPWAPGALEPATAADTVVLIGAGLTMVDIAITLGRDDGPRMIALSRHGVLPQAHLPDRPQREIDVVDLTRDVGDLIGLTDRIRQRAADGASGDDWRDVIDSVRPFVNALWQRADHAEQRAFLAHLSRYWDVHRHRMSPPTAARLGALLDRGQLANYRGRVVTAQGTAAGVNLDVVLDGRPTRLQPDVVVNCTGPGRSWQAPANPVVTDLIEQGAATPDFHGIGLATTATGCLIGRDGEPVESIFVIGPPRRGTLFETTAIPELRSQALHIADQIAVDSPA